MGKTPLGSTVYAAAHYLEFRRVARLTGLVDVQVECERLLEDIAQLLLDRDEAT